jgi:hydroxymethylglutaryl-CoA reductase (NADPH)
VLSALFLATGQDIAHVVEGSLGITTTEITSGGIYISIYLPDLVVGTIGGGTRLPAQMEALDILNVSGGKSGENAAAFAEIIGGAVLAGEISLLGALANSDLTRAHLKLARGK